MSHSSPLLSVIIPVYNAEKYLRQSIDSVLGQTIGFSKNIQLILVDDGSTDTSLAICNTYKEKFPDNILVLSKSNGGVSSTRNHGLRRATGEYVTFLDSDDVWSKGALKKMVNFLSKHDSEVDVVAAKIQFFDADNGYHPSNYKFKKTRIIDLTNDPDNPLFHLPTCVFKRSAIADVYFNEKIKITEDGEYLSRVLYSKKAYGVVSGPTYYYRKRTDQSSAVGGQRFVRHYYTDTVDLAYGSMLDVWTSDDGAVHKFMQYEILSDLTWRLRQEEQSILSESEEADYKQRIRSIINLLDDDVILHRRGLSVDERLYLLRVKHGRSLDKHISLEKGNIFYKNMSFGSLSSSLVTLDFVHHVKPHLVEIEGYASVAALINHGYLSVKTKDQQVVPPFQERAQLKKTFLGDAVSSGGGFKVTIPVSDNDEITFSLSDGSTALKINPNRFSGLSRLNYSYSKKGSLLLQRRNRRIIVRPLGIFRSVGYEILYLLRIVLYWRLKDSLRYVGKNMKYGFQLKSRKAVVSDLLKPLLIFAEAVAMIPRAILFRILFRIVSLVRMKPIWIISDRGMAAGDNGEALFKYIYSDKRRTTKNSIYFAVSKKSPDYGRLKKIGKVLHYGGLRYKFKFLLAEKIISSHADIEVTNPFLRQIDHFVDLYRYDFVFLQHGVIRNDLSGWLNRYEQNIHLFITSAKKEYDSLFQYPYYYPKDRILLSGLPRYDYLETNPSKRLVIMPTYRKSLLRSATNKYGARKYSKDFKKSQYFKMYDTLINDHRLLAAMREHDMAGDFLVHPNFAAQINDFKYNNFFQRPTYPYDYPQIFKEGSLLVSDYSSVIFDFAYLKKPIIYFQFDKDDFYQTHSYQRGDFFDDAQDGFGLVTDDYEDLIADIINTIESGCGLSAKYKNRVEKFFYKIDRMNSKRVYDAIIKISG